MMTRLLAAALLCATITFGQAALAQSNITPADNSAWGENVGWTNWSDANGGLSAVVVGSTYLSGFVWCENVGWLNLGDGTPGGGTGYANVDGSDFGVNIAGGGNLTGYAWGENIGWVNFDTSSLGTDRARFDSAAGRFRGYVWGENVGWINLDDSVNFVGVDLPAPANDDCANALVIHDGTFMGTLEYATNDGGASCGSSGTSPDVWYSYTASCTGTVLVSTCGTHDGPGVDLGIDTVLSVHLACPGTAGNQLACNDDAFNPPCTGLDTGIQRDSSVEVSLAVGETVLIRVANYNNSATGPFTLNVSCTQSAPEFQRGDCNNDASKNIADPVRLLNFLFPAAPPPTPLDCDSACDANDDGGLNIADAVAMLNVLFPTGPPVPWLAPDLCGVDPTADGLDCAGYSHCP